MKLAKIFWMAVGFLLVAAAVVPASGAGPDDVRSQDIRVVVSVIETPLLLSVKTDMSVSGLAVGQTVTFVPDGAGGYVTNGVNVFSVTSVPAEFNIHGDPHAAVLISFALPMELYNESGNSVIYMNYNGTSAVWGSRGNVSNYFDPRVPEQVYLDSEGDCDVSMGGIITVGPTAAQEQYTGDAIVTVSYAVN